MIKENIIEYFKLPTPCVIYDLSILENHLNMLEMVINEKINVLYSLKANSNLKIINTLNNHNLIRGFECASIQECNKVKHLKNNYVSLVGPSFSVEDIKEIYNAGYIYDFNSFSQLKNMGNHLKNRDIGIRIRTTKSYIEYKEENLSSRFGISLSEFNDPAKKLYIRKNNINIKSIHFHGGEKDATSISNLIKMVNDLLKMDIFSSVESINFGGGWKYLFDNKQLNFETDRIVRELQDKNINIYIEPGRLITDSCGFLLGKVIDVSNYNSRQNIVLNISAHNLLTWFPTYPIANNSVKNKKIKTCIWGNSCYEEDFFIKNYNISEVTINDKILFYPFGSYYKNNSKKLHDLEFPKEVYFNDGKIL